jgi:signal transduction histidine kinase
MQALIRDLLAYSRLSQHKTINRQTVNLNQLINEVLIDLEVAVEDSRALLTIGELPTLPGDPSQLRQVFQNLLSNALKFTEPGKTPHITLSSHPIQWTDIPEDVIFAHKPKQTYWQITVADNGIGFKETYRERIFGAFERLHSKSSPYTGTGIGLAIAKRVVENHGGAISAQSSPGLGATFYLYLPA